ncbi:zinc-dependent peptidase [Solitalea lacus]|uniref:M90 family metallopeptidase n=1 Tax=Solitalea lacus TaxID=2911172 RepID=UPI001EDA0774|nr:M90 family metallopeptidase [Solitalea lacus]UKJ08804.1 zinc-dependent peptidase [Solitalea lacus]
MGVIIGFLAVAVLIWLVRNYLGLNKRTINPAIVNLKTILEDEVVFYQRLSPEKRIVFEQKIVQFLSSVSIEGVGVQITDLDRVLIASSAVIPVFYFDNWRYKNLTNVLLYPNSFNEQFQFEGGCRNIGGMVGTGFMNGQMILSQRELRQGFKNYKDDSNTGIHEFVHLLDKSDGEVDGIPENLLNHRYTIPWLKLMHQEIKEIKHGGSDIDPYGATNEGEFFAVAAEYFFEQPQRFQERHPQLYEMMQMVFNIESRP